ncbi:MAG TPA: class I SAM-dependent methyltransferase [Armatimonadota bacterium]|jgi:SAM-dependent methyltransferase
MPDYSEHIAANRRLWEEWTPIHETSAFYNVDAFRQGRDTLQAEEIASLGDVAGRSLLHLQCHFGMDTMSLARRGAVATGLDFSPRSIDLARSLARETGIAADFVCANVYDAVEALEGQTFDIVFTGGGALSWLPDLAEWGRVAGRLVKPGGFLYVRDAHPFAYIFEQGEGEVQPTITYPYFHSDEALIFPNARSYADPSAPVSEDEHTWCFSLSDVVNAVIGGGLRLDWLREFATCGWRMFPCMEQDSSGRWRWPGREQSLPFTFSLKATKA